MNILSQNADTRQAKTKFWSLSQLSIKHVTNSISKLVLDYKVYNRVLSSVPMILSIFQHKKMPLINLISLFFFLFLSSCFSFRQTLEVGDLNSFSAREQIDGTTLTIRGQFVNSYIIIGDIEYQRVGTDVIINIYTAKPKSNSKAKDSFTEVISVVGVDRVLFGTQRKEIWKRK